MTVASHAGDLSRGRGSAVWAAAHWLWHAMARAWHGLAAAATMGVAAEKDYRPARYAYLERAEMARYSKHL